MTIGKVMNDEVTIVPNSIINDNRLSLGASGLYARLLCTNQSDNFNFKNLNSNENLLKLDVYLKELEKYGYIVVKHDNNGKTLIIKG